jgi:predicted amidohydrolase
VLLQAMKDRTMQRVMTLFISSLAVVMAVGCSQFDKVPEAPDEPQQVRVAGIVLKWVRAEKEINYKRAEPLIREAADQGAQLVITTECFLDGYAIRDKSIPIDRWHALGEPIPGGAYLMRLQELADELDIYLVAGMLEGVGRTTYNSAVLIGPDGKLIGRYRKQHMGHELVRNTPGEDSPVFDTPFGKVGLMICADRRYPQTIARLGEAGAELMLCPSGGMWGPIKNDHHLQARSRENSVPIVFVHPIEFLVTGPDGAILDRRFAGDHMDVPVDGIHGEDDQHLVAIYDLSLK